MTRVWGVVGLLYLQNAPLSVWAFKVFQTRAPAAAA
jgi:hypothetical protein